MAMIVQAALRHQHHDDEYFERLTERQTSDDEGSKVTRSDRQAGYEDSGNTASDH